MIGLEKSIPMMYSNLGLSFRWTLPLIRLSFLFSLFVQVPEHQRLQCWACAVRMRDPFAPAAVAGAGAPALAPGLPAQGPHSWQAADQPGAGARQAHTQQTRSPGSAGNCLLFRNSIRPSSVDHKFQLNQPSYVYPWHTNISPPL